MFQIDNSTAVAVEPAPAAAGAAGFFTDGNPALNIPATIVGADWFNQVTDELLNILTAAGVTPSKATRNQVVTAINKLIAAGIAGTFQVYAGNPNGHVAGTQGNAGAGAFPSVVWDTANDIWWVCTTTGNAAAAAWTESGAVAAWPFWCGTAGGTSSAIALTPPAAMTSFGAGQSVAFQVAANNAGAVTVTVGTFGTWPLYKDGPAGPIPLAGGELVAGNIVTARVGSADAHLHLIATEMGTAALANASANTGTVAAVTGAVTAGTLPLYNDTGGTLKAGPALSSAANSTVATVQGAGAITPGHVAIFQDPNGTVKDGGALGVAPAPTYLTVAANNTVLGAGVYACDTRTAVGGAFTLKLPPTPTPGAICWFFDPFGSWGANALTLDRNGSTIKGMAENLICNVAGEEFRAIFDGVNNTWTLE